jgi:hypothetical protein
MLHRSSCTSPITRHRSAHLDQPSAKMGANHSVNRWTIQVGVDLTTRTFADRSACQVELADEMGGARWRSVTNADAIPILFRE